MIRDVIRKLRSIKTYGSDDVPAELWKSDVDNTKALITSLVVDIWEMQKYLPPSLQ